MLCRAEGLSSFIVWGAQWAFAVQFMAFRCGMLSCILSLITSLFVERVLFLVLLFIRNWISFLIFNIFLFIMIFGS